MVERFHAPGGKPEFRLEKGHELLLADGDCGYGGVDIVTKICVRELDRLAVVEKRHVKCAVGSGGCACGTHRDYWVSLIQVGRWGRLTAVTSMEKGTVVFWWLTKEAS